MSLYHEAAEFLLAPTSDGGSLKARVFKKKGLKSPPNQLYALVLETCKWSVVLKEVIERAELLKLERKLTPALSLLLTHDLLLAKGGIALPQSHGLRQSVERHKGRLTSELTLARLRRRSASTEQLREQVERASAGEEANIPRWVRVNALRSSVEDQLETTFAAYKRTTELQEGTDLTKTDAYGAGKIILQDKASCFPAYLLDPRSEDGDVVDACAAPGNKTTHLAAVLHGHRPEFESAPQTIFAFEKDSRRAQTLEKMVRIAGSRKQTVIAPGQDFLQVDPEADKYKDVGVLLLDPSCSGSGIVGRDSMPELHLPDALDKQSQGKGAPPPKNGQTVRKRKHGEVEKGEKEASQNLLIDDEGNETVVNSSKDLQARLEALSSFQLIILLHAFKFPSAKRITYSTCSVHAAENERVVMKALQSDIARRRGWRILRRDDQVSGLRDWDVRGLPEECGGDTEIAEGCIRSHKGDGRGVMGFFVAGFVRSDGDADGRGGGGDDSDEGPYLRDVEGRIVRDQLGMPVLKSTGEPVTLIARDESDEEDDSSGGTPDDQATDEVEEDEWDGFGD
uniref:SAM-dependent MTase RsmB/NOP-type domain-containing protein n=1 Tax=Bionectria ochroleuca TaxID=29856 RepID=A0A0B7JR96_BIOOC